jgi:hypothetical protein
MRNTLTLASVAITLCLTTIARAQSPWDGTYALDVNKSHLAGDTIAFTKTPDGMWHFIDGADTYNFLPDGKPYPLGGPDRTESITMPDPHTMDVVIRVKGKPLVTLHQTLSPDTNTFTEAATSAFTNHVVTTVLKRTGPGEGFLGKWTSTQVTSDSSDSKLSIQTTPAGVFTWTWTHETSKIVVTGKPDGTPLHNTDPHLGPDQTIAFKTISPTRMEFTNRIKDHITTVGYLQLSADTKTLDDVYWGPTDPSTKGDKLYVKQ